MKTIAELVGGGCDGVLLDPTDSEEPDDWADYIEILNKRTGRIEGYTLRGFKPKVVGNLRVYYYDLVQD